MEINEKSKQKLKFTKNEKMWVTDILNYQARIHKLQESIKEQYNVDSSFDFETFTLHLKDSEINESYNLASAKEYAVRTIGEANINVIYED